MDPGILQTFFVIFTGGAIIATLALFGRQPLIIAYVVLGILIGPAGLELIQDGQIVKDAAEIGIIFLLYLLGLSLVPQKLGQMLSEALVLTGLSCLAAFVLGISAGLLLQLPLTDTLILATALMFSSTILGLKLLPTTALHHRHAGEIIISVLLLQDLLAIIALTVLRSMGNEDQTSLAILGQLAALPLLIGIAWGLGRYLMPLLLQRFDRFQEYLFLLALGWGLGLAELAHYLGLSYETGAFIAGVSLATSPISLLIVESLKPLRDFFLVIFFVALGAGLPLDQIQHLILPAVLLALAVLVLKPLVFQYLMQREGEEPGLSREISVRLGQISEFSLLIAVVALDSGLILESTGTLLQLTTLICFALSSYWIVARYPTPVAMSENLRRD